MPKSTKTKHVNLQFFTRWGMDQLRLVKESVAAYLAKLKMHGITIVSHIFNTTAEGKTQLIVKITVTGVNKDDAILEFVKKVIYDLQAIPTYRESHAHA